MSKEEVLNSCPLELEPYEVAYRLRTNRKDTENWQLGQYIAMAIGNCLSKSDKYPDKPLFQIEDREEKSKSNNEEIAVFEMKQRIRLLEQQGLPPSPE